MKLKNIAVAVVLISSAITATRDASAQVIVLADNQPAGTPSPPTANPATYIASNSFTANWSRASGATGYRLDVSPNSSFNTYVTGYQNLNVANATNRSVTGLNASTTYYYRVRAYNGAGTSGNSNVVNVTTLTATGPPVVYTNPATLIASFSATLNGSVDPHGLPTTVYFEYGTTTAYGRTTANQTKTGNTYQNVSANISGLTPSTTYHFRIWATNSAGTVHGIDRTFTTLSATGPPVVITNPATFIASLSATLNGSVDPHGLATTVYFQYGTTTAYGQTTANQSKSGNTYQNVAGNINGLTPSTLYHFRIVATNSGGTRFGVDRTFTTLSATGPPVVITNPATNVASSSSTLNGSVNPHGLSTTVNFQYGTTTGYGQTTANQTRSGNTYQNVAANISGLTPSTTYHFRISATNSAGTVHGIDRTFTTLSSATPTPTPTCTPACTPGTWMQAGPLPVDLYGSGAENDGVYIYSAGGYSLSLGGDQTAFYRSTNGGMTWGVISQVPVATSLPGFVYAPNVNKLFMFGGVNTNTATVYNTTRIYNIATNTWSTGATMPGPRQQMAAGYYNGKIYVAAGYSNGNPGSETNTIWEYDPVANTWNTSRANMPASVSGPGYGIINGHLYVAGGRNTTFANLNTLYDYDIVANTWTQRANLPTAVNVPGSTVICGKLWVFGGGSPFFGSGALHTFGENGVQLPDTANTLQIYNPATNTWTSGPSLNQQRSFSAGTHLGNTAIAIGGYTGTTTTTSVEINVTTSGCGP